MHLFVECPFSCIIWEHVANWSNCENLHPAQWGEAMDVEDWFLQMIEKGSKKAHTLAILTLWCIWNQRNAAVFNNKQMWRHRCSLGSKTNPSCELVLEERSSDLCLLEIIL
jgi:hypothetical protein